MKLSCLEEYGIPRLLIDAWARSQGDGLLPLQERAVRDYGLLDGGSLIISAPTSSGKTFCGELAAARMLAQRRKVVFLVPLKALAEERFREFEEKYRPIGIRAVISTRDRRESDRAIEAGQFDLAVIIYEKFNQMLLRNLDLLSSIDLLVIDELQMLADENRGATLETLILKVLNSSYECRVIGLSAVLGNAHELADWMGARILVESHRPVELRQGVLLNDTFSFRCFNSGENGTEQMAPAYDMSSAEILIENVEKLARDGEQVLVFLKSKSSCVQLAGMLAERFSSSSSESAADDLASGEETLLTEPLIRSLKSGIAFHTADLTHSERRIVEKHYSSGDIRVIFATTTLSLGLNLPAQTVFLETCKYRQGTYTGRPVIETLSWNDYENMCGRAGRLRFPAPFGRSIVIANSELEGEMLWNTLIRGRPDRLRGRLFSRELSDILLDLIVSRSASSAESLSSILCSAFSELTEETAARIDDALLWLAECDMVVESDGDFVSTSYGRKLACLGISTSTGANLRMLFGSDADYSELVWLYELCDTFEGNRIYVPRTFQEDAEQRLHQRFRSLAGNEIAVSPRLADLLDNPNRVGTGTLSRIRLVLALHDWAHGRSLVEIEKQYRIYAGAIQTAGDTIGWLAEGAFCLMGTMGQRLRRRLTLKRLSYEVRNGLPAAVRKLHGAVRESLSRADMLLLYEQGITAVDHVISSDPGFLAGIIGSSKSDDIMRRLAEKLSPDPGAAPPVSAGYGKERPILRLTGVTLRDRYRVMLCERPFLLTAKSFKYLFKLAAQRKLDPGGWLDKERLEPGFNQARYLYNLKKELGSPAVRGQELIENDRRGRYRLCLAPDEIGFEFSSLSGLEDFEIAELLRRLSSV
jgi:helicase